MNAPKKWIDGARLDEPATQVAGRTWSARFSDLRHQLTLAALHADKSREHVHDLRVSSRRVSSALALYRALVPERAFEKVRKRVREIRRAAGPARDLDVLIERLLDVDPEVIAYLRSERENAQAAIVDVHAKLDTDFFDGPVRTLTERLISANESPPFAEYATLQIAHRAELFFAAAPLKSRAISDLHAFRIRTKHLRYAMELTSSAFGPEFRESLYPRIERAQELLGAINDHANARARFESWTRGHRANPPIRNQRALWRSKANGENELTEHAIDRFVAWWDGGRSVELEAQFRKLLSS